MILGLIPGTTFLVWLSVGIVAGIIMHLIDKREVKGGILATVITGLLGALIGGFLSSAIFGIGEAGLNITSIVVAVAGGLIFSFIQRIVTDTKEEDVFKVQERNEQLEEENEQFMRENYSYPETAGLAYYSQVYPKDESKKVSSVKIQSFIEDVDYPATKDELIRIALMHGADDNVVKSLKELPEDTYYSSQGVSEDLGQL